MSTVEKSIRLYAWKKNYETFSIVQGEIDSRKFSIELFDNTAPINLTTATVMLFATKPDSTAVYRECSKEDAVNGKVSLLCPDQLATVSGTFPCWIQVLWSDGSDLRFDGMQIEVASCGLEAAMHSSDDFQALIEAGNVAKQMANEIKTARLGYKSLADKNNAQDANIGTRLSVYDYRRDKNAIDALFEQLKSRIDELVAVSSGPSDGNTELADVRVGADGTVYPTAGDAVRAQIEELQEIFSDFVIPDGSVTPDQTSFMRKTIENEVLENVIDLYDKVTGAYDSSGNFTVDTNTLVYANYFYTTDYIPYYFGNVTVLIYQWNTQSSAMSGLACFDKKKNFIGLVTGERTDTSVERELTVPAGTAYIRYQYRKRDTGAVVKVYSGDIKYTFDESVKGVSEEPKLITDADVDDDAGISVTKLGNLDFEYIEGETDLTEYYPPISGWINASGQIVDNANWYHSDPIECAGSLRVVSKKKNGRLAFAFYDNNDAFLGSTETGYLEAGAEVTVDMMEGASYFRFSNSGSTYTVSAYISQTTALVDFRDSSKVRWVPKQKFGLLDEQIAGLQSLLWNYTKWNGKTLVADGNSLVASSNWARYLAESLGMNLYNIGRSGGAIIANNSTVDTVTTRVANDYPDTADLIILQGDTNRGMDGDYDDQVDGDNPKTTWCALMNWHIRCLRAKYHNAVIVLMPDSIRYDGFVKHQEKSLNEASYQAMKGIAHYNRLAFFEPDFSTPYFPLYDDNYYSRLGVADSGYTTNDSVHPYTTYVVAKGRALTQFVAGLIFNPDAPNSATVDWQNDIK